MTPVAGLLVLLVAPAAPLALAIAALLRPSSIRLAAYAICAALPALATSLLMPTGIAATLPWLLEGSDFGLDTTGRIFLFCSAALWAACALYARDSVGRDHRTRFFACFLLAMGGNFGLIIARDMLSFYTFFTLMSLAAYGLIVHDGSDGARRAGRVYVALVIAGDLMLYGALALLTFDTGGSLLFEAARAAVVESANRDLILALLVLGFGVKVGLLGMHVSLPLIYAAAPTAAAAALAGAMLNAGLLGWLRMLPLGADGLSGWGGLLIGLGVAAAFYGVIVGLLQRRATEMLAYSSISQVGIVTLALGFGLGVPSAAPSILAAVTLYATHHAFAKAALFLGNGIRPLTHGAGFTRVVGVIALLLPALALTGAPLTSGLLVKDALKEALSAGDGRWEWLASLLPFTALATTLIMARFLWQVRRRREIARREPASSAMQVAFMSVVVLTATATWALPLPRPTALWSPGVLWSAIWPVVLGAAVAAVAARYLRRPVEIAPGDVLAAAARLARFGGQLWNALAARWLPELRDRVRSRVAARKQPTWLWLVIRTEATLARWHASVALFIVLVLGLWLAGHLR